MSVIHIKYISQVNPLITKVKSSPREHANTATLMTLRQAKVLHCTIVRTKTWEILFLILIIMLFAFESNRSFIHGLAGGQLVLVSQVG